MANIPPVNSSSSRTSNAPLSFQDQLQRKAQEREAREKSNTTTTNMKNIHERPNIPEPPPKPVSNAKAKINRFNSISDESEEPLNAFQKRARDMAERANSGAAPTPPAKPESDIQRRIREAKEKDKKPPVSNLEGKCKEVPNT